MYHLFFDKTIEEQSDRDFYFYHTKMIKKPIYCEERWELSE